MDTVDTATLRSALDRIIPRSGGMPGAGDTEAVGFVSERIEEGGAPARLAARGLEEIASEAAAAGGALPDLPPDERDEVLRAVEARSPGPFGELVRLCYGGYYTDPAVLGLLGDDARPPQPSGHRIERGDLSALRAVVERGPIYRPVRATRGREERR